MKKQKQLLSLALALCLLLSLAPAVLAADSPRVPTEGETVHGFRLLESWEMPVLDATVYHYTHEKSGAELVYIANDDPDRSFQLNFRTEPIDNTGVPHVFEHATINGSEKYPVPLLFNMSFQSYNTYINAFTASWMTGYPVSSLSEAQLLKLADWYTDCCLHPLVLRDESIFRSEGWRYRMESPEAPLTIEGTVYSEMQGAYTLQRIAPLNAYAAAYPGSYAGNLSGGVPSSIPDLTWQEMKEYHAKYYHPSNCAVLLYGKLEDYTAFLALLDEAFSPYDRLETFGYDDAGYTPITEPVTRSVPFPVEAGAETENASSIYYVFVCHGADLEALGRLSQAADLFGADSSALMQELRQRFPAASFGVSVEFEGAEPCVQFSAMNMGKEDAAAFQAIVDKAVADAAANGFPQELAEALQAQKRLNLSLTREDGEAGRNTLLNLAYLWFRTGEIRAYEALLNAGDEIAGQNREGQLAAAVSTYLAGSRTTALVTTWPAAGEKEKQDAAEAARLAQVKAAMGDEEIAAIVAHTNAEQEEADTSAYVRALTAVTVQTLPEEYETHTIRDTTDAQGVRHLDAVAAVHGVGATQLFLDAAGVAQEDLHWLLLLTALCGELDTAQHTKEEMDTLLPLHLTDAAIDVDTLGSGADFHPYLTMSWIALEEEQASAFSLMEELLKTSRLDDIRHLQEYVTRTRATLRNSINSYGYQVLMRRAFAREDPEMRYQLYLSGLDFYAFLTETEALLQSDPAAVTANLERVRAQLLNRSGAIAVYAGTEAGIAANRTLEDAFFAGLESRVVTPVRYSLPVPAQRECLVLDTGVNHNIVSAGYATMGAAGYDAAMDAMNGYLDDLYLMPLLRYQYGVYTPTSMSYPDNGTLILAYRDPNVRETFAVFDALPELLAQDAPTQEELDGYILANYSGYAKPGGALSAAASEALRIADGRPQDEPLLRMRELKAFTPERFQEYVKMYRALVEKGYRGSCGPASAMAANAGDFDAVLDPFGMLGEAGETGDAGLFALPYADVPEDAWFREAVELCWYNGLLPGPEETVFDPEGHVSLSDAAELLAALAGESGIEDALAWAQEQELIVPADGEGPDSLLTREQAAGILWRLGKDMEAHTQGKDYPNGFLDAGNVSEENQEAMRWAVGIGMIDGEAEDSLQPKAPVTRAQFAVMTARLLEAVAVG